jgi:hypothetical protein
MNIPPEHNSMLIEGMCMYILTFVPRILLLYIYIYIYIHNTQTNSHLIESLLYYCVFIPRTCFNSMCLGSTQPRKNKYQDTPGDKDGRYVRLTTYHLQVPMSWNLEALTSQNPLGPISL